eukprot:6388848-Prymnesium_polylepis.1
MGLVIRTRLPWSFSKQGCSPGKGPCPWVLEEDSGRVIVLRVLGLCDSGGGRSVSSPSRLLQLLTSGVLNIRVGEDT